MNLQPWQETFLKQLTDLVESKPEGSVLRLHNGRFGSMVFAQKASKHWVYKGNKKWERLPR